MAVFKKRVWLGVDSTGYANTIFDENGDSPIVLPIEKSGDSRHLMVTISYRYNKKSKGRWYKPRPTKGEGEKGGA